MQPSIFDIIPDPGVQTRDPDWKAKALVEQAVAPDMRPSEVPGFTVDELTALRSFAASLAPRVDMQPAPGSLLHGRRWDHWINEGAATHLYRLPMIMPGHGADICMTRTRLGWTGGFRLRAGDGSCECGFTCHPGVDDVGRYYVTTEQAAQHDGLRRLYQQTKQTKFGKRLWVHFLDLGHDITEPVPEATKRRIYDFARKGIPNA